MLLDRLRRLGLRTRLALAFLAVSVPPVLVGSAIAVAAISEAFGIYIDGWLDETAVFLANDLSDSRTEAERVVRVLADRWHTAPSLLGDTDQLRTEFAAEVLRSVGYDTVVVYRRGGEVIARSGEIPSLHLPDGPGGFITFTEGGGLGALVVGASTALGSEPDAPLLLIGDAVNDRYNALRQGILSLNVRIYQRSGEHFVEAARANGERQGLERQLTGALLEGRRSHVVYGPNGTSAAYAAIRGADGTLLGLVSCELSRPLVLFLERWRRRLFAALFVVSVVLSIVVGIAVATRLARPVRALITGMRAATQGDYSHRVPEEGGRELAELGRGFNSLAERLEDLRRVEAELGRQRHMAALGEAAAVIAHEIRNPLGIIKTSADLLRSRAPLAPADLRLLDYVRDEVDRIGRLVREMLATVTPGGLSLARCDLAVLVRDVAGFLGPSLQQHQITACLEPLAAITIDADADRLREVLLNLALNAIDAMPKGGRLRFGIEPSGPGAVRVTVADDGIGMTPEVAARIFDPFFTTKARGSGLGLARAQAIVAQHGGTISCRSEPGRGSQFIIELPLTQPGR